ncbi:unnamed protein product [Urochloa decumbens]|uniref:Ubiquitinyl hydrolase 1 n=1 Tax=Urochloa decumbens TaxID=240449 RepID=A0ABC9EIR8_9POAL
MRHAAISQRKGGDRSPASPPLCSAPASAAIAAKRKGKKVLSPSLRSSEGSMSDIIPVSGAGESSHANETLVDSCGRSNVSWKIPLVEGIMEVPKVTRHIDLNKVSDNMFLDRKWTEAEEMEMQQWQQQGKPPTIWPEKVHRKSLWSKLKGGMENRFSERIQRQMHDSNPDSIVIVPHVNHQTIPMTGIIEHYELIEMAAGRGVIVHSNALDLRRAYSEFRTVHGDGDGFYMSFIFSYLEQVLDRHDRHEEHRLLAAVKGVARQHASLGWTSEFSWSHKAFKMLIKKVMRWKRHRRWKHAPTTKSYRKQKLLDFFSGHARTNDSELVAATWICSHSEEFEPLVPELNEDYTLRDWCSREVIQCKVFTDHVQMTALVTALGVPLRIEYLLQGAGQDFYTGQEDSHDETPRSTCWPRRRPQAVPRGHVVPRVTVLYTNAHYDIIYPHCRDGPSVDESCIQQIAQVQRMTAAASSSNQQNAQGDSWSGENSSQHIAKGKSSTGVRIQINMTCGRKLTSTSVHEYYDEHRSIAD